MSCLLFVVLCSVSCLSNENDNLFVVLFSVSCLSNDNDESEKISSLISVIVSSYHTYSPSYDIKIIV